MKVLQIYKDFYPPVIGGIECHINVLAKGLIKNGIGVKVLVSNTCKKLTKDKIDGIEVVKTPEFGRIASAPINPNFTRLLKSLSKDVDILHFHLPNPTSVISFLVSRIEKPLIVTYHSDIVRQEKLYHLYKPFEKKFLPKVDRIIATSPSYIQTSSVLKKFRKKCSVIPLGIEIERYKEVNIDKVIDIRKKYKKPIVLFIGKFRYYKGLHILIEAIKDVDASLVIIGNGDNKLLKKHYLNSNIHFLGELNNSDVNLYLNACNFLVLPSVVRSEAYGVVLLEAMACGKAVISTELGTGTSFVNLHEKTGLVVPSNSSSELSKAMKCLLYNNNLCERFGENGKKRVNKLFTDEKMISDTIALYGKVINKWKMGNVSKYKFKKEYNTKPNKKIDSKQLLFINQYYPPDRSATAGVLDRIVNYLSNCFSINIIVGHPSYLSVEKYKWKPISFFYKENAKIIRVGSFAYPRKNSFYRSLNYLSYFFISVAIAITIKSEIIIAMTDPPLAGIIGAIAAKIKKKPFVYYIQDLHPEMAIASGMIKHGIITKIWDLIHKAVLQSSDKIITIGDDMKERLIKKGVNSKKIVVIRHGSEKQYDEDEIDEELVAKIRKKYKFTFIHAGNIGYYGAWKNLICAIKEIKNNEIGFIFVGEGQKKTMLMELSKDYKNIEFVPYQPRRKFRSVLEAGDIHMITIKEGLEGLIVPSKLYTILTAHKPILAICPEKSDVAKIVRKFNCGIVASPDSQKEILEAMNHFYYGNCLFEYKKNTEKAAEFYNKDEQLKYFRNEIVKTKLLRRSLKSRRYMS